MQVVYINLEMVSITECVLADNLLYWLKEKALNNFKEERTDRDVQGREC